MLHYQYLASFYLVRFNGSEHIAGCTSVCGAAGTMNVEPVGWEYVLQKFASCRRIFEALEIA